MAKDQVIIDTIIAQRNEALNAVAMLRGEIAERDARIAELEKRFQKQSVNGHDADAGLQDSLHS